MDAGVVSDTSTPEASAVRAGPPVVLASRLHTHGAARGLGWRGSRVISHLKAIPSACPCVFPQ